MNRQLTAIMFADMVGYTALMQEDEDRAKQSRDRNRDVLVREVEKHQGNILQFYGDGALSVFQSAILAVECSIAIQTDLRKDPPVPVRVGIHTGDIIYDDEGVFGDGVNLAARVQGLATPGGVLISEKVFDEVKNQSGILTRSMGSFALKNVKRPMEVWAIANDGLVVPDPTEMGSRPSDYRNSIAVLPFMNMSSDPENEFFSDGITEEIINALTRVNGLQVTARTSSFAFKGKNLDVRTIGEELGVSTVLEGSVRRAGNRVRIAAQLINTKDGYHLFSEVYDRDITDIFETQDELARTIMEELEGQFLGDVAAGSVEAKPERRVHHPQEASSPTEDPAPSEIPGRGIQGGERERPRLVPHHVHDTEAYTEFLKGAHAFQRWSPEGSRAAIRHFQRSIEMDPDCGLPYAGMGTAYTFLAAIGHMHPKNAYARAREAAQKALELEDGSGAAHAAMATVLFFHDWDFDGAYRHFQKAISLTPGAAPLRRLYAMYLKAMGDGEGAEEELQLALQLDPLSSLIRTALGETLLHLDRAGEAEAQLKQVLELDPEFRSAREMLGWAYAAQDRVPEAMKEFEEIIRRTGDPFKVIPHRIFALTAMGRREEARQLFGLLEERRRREPEVSLEVDFCFAHMGLGEIEKAMDYMEEAVELRLGFVLFMGGHRIFDPVRSHPRFVRLQERIGLPALPESS